MRRKKPVNPYDVASDRCFLFIGLGLSSAAFLLCLYAGIAAVTTHVLIKELETDLVLTGGHKSYAFYVLALVGFSLTMTALASVLRHVVVMKTVKWLVGSQTMFLDEVLHLMGNCALAEHGVDFDMAARETSGFKHEEEGKGTAAAAAANDDDDVLPELPVGVAEEEGTGRRWSSFSSSCSTSSSPVHSVGIARRCRHRRRRRWRRRRRRWKRGRRMGKEGPFKFSTPVAQFERTRPVSSGLIGLGVDRRGHWSFRAQLSSIQTAQYFSGVR